MVKSKSRSSAHSKKWHKYPYINILPLWIADMDFQSSAFVKRAFRQQIDNNNNGYGNIPQDLNEALKSFIKISKVCFG
jgi:bifunctional pyridoxal-dependent enzyme with beta-cystathionase and maltose regulon repressor activities